MDRTLSRMVAGVLALGLMGLLGADAKAGFTVTLASSGANGGGATLFNYTASIANGDTISAGSYFRIYDFAGYVVGSAVAPTGWSVTETKFDPTPGFILVHGDDAALYNLTFTYTGTGSISGAATIAGFSGLTAFNGELDLSNFVGSNATASGGSVDTMGDVNVPKNNNIYAAPAPEPASVISMAVGAALLGLTCYRRRARLA